MANTASTIFSVTPLAGIDMGAKSSSPAFAPLTLVNGNNGREHIYVRASEALGSTDTIKIGAAGSASSDSGSAGWSLAVAGGLTAGQYAWSQRTAI
jgi:hypothetical protein